MDIEAKNYELEAAKIDILREAAKHKNQICKLQSPDGGFVKVRRGYSQPDELRATYNAALNSLLKNGSIKFVFKNSHLELYEVTAAASQATTLRSAMERVLEEMQTSGSVYKIHSERGEFVQCGENAFDMFEHERILMMQALHELLHNGKIQVVYESREMCRFELAPASHTGYVQYHRELQETA